MEAAAKDWGVPVAELAVDKGVITHAKSNRSTTYGKIATAASKLEVPKDADVTLKDPKTWKIAGKPLNRLDTPDKLTGKQIYSIDVTLPGMLNATIIDAPLFGAKLRSYDEAKAKVMPGVRGIYPVGETAVAVVADTFWQAKKAVLGYTIPNLLIEHAMRGTHVPPHFWRGVNNNQNAIWLECFLDEVAMAAGKDPLEFRRQLMGNHPKHLAVLNAVADKIGWGKAQPPAGVFRGIAQHMGYGSYVAAAAEVSVSDRGRLRIHRLVMGTDCGNMVNPAQVTAQVEGSVAYGLGAALYQECTIKGGRVEQENFDTL
jgi:CO/xanthine dehydrogenase Mo-binding subunit